MEQGGIHMRKREGLFYNWQRIVAALLIIVVSMTSLSLENLAADNVLQEENSVEKYEKEYEISRDNVIESENTENSTTYDMGDGLRVTEFYAQDVRFQDEEGKRVDYDSSLVEVNEEISSLGNILDYTNSTQSKIQNVFTQDIPNGTYTLKLTMEDLVLC